MNNKDNLLSVIETLFKWKKPILIVAFIATVGTVVFSLFMDNYYESTTLFIPASPDQAKPPVVGASIKERYYYGQPEDIDRMLSIANSEEVASHLIEKFDLYEHYDIDTTHEKAGFFVQKELGGLFEVTKTKLDAIEISIEDTEPEMAVNMVNAARDKIEEIARGLIKSTQGTQVQEYENRIASKRSELNEMGDSLQNLRQRYNIYNSYSQSVVLSEMYLTVESQLAGTEAKLEFLKATKGARRDSIIKVESMLKGLERKESSLAERLENFNQGMSKVRLFEELHENASDQLGLDLENYKQIKATYNSEFPVLYIIEKGSKPIVKSRPKRTILVIGAGFIAFLLACVGALLFDAYREVDWKKIINA